MEVSTFVCNLKTEKKENHQNQTFTNGEDSPKFAPFPTKITCFYFIK